MPPAELFAQLVKLPRGHARRRKKELARRRGADNRLDCLLAGHFGIVWRLFLEAVRGERVFSHDQRVGRAVLFKMKEGRIELGAGGGLVLGKQRVGELQRAKQRLLDAPLSEVLRLVMDARLAAPADDKERGNAVDRRVAEREQRIDSVPQSGVLHIHHRNASCGQMEARGKGERRPLVYRSKMFVFVCVITYKSAEAFKERVRHTGKKRRAVCF